ncbi:MAG: penicillin-binding protein 2 [Rhodothermales bacterium]|nr:penicillin-binding protein 2 [Rhodothermales bacterium]
MIGDSVSGSQSDRARIFSLVVLAVLGLLMVRLVQLQIVNSSEYTGESRDNSMREIRVLPARGTILDRQGTVLVDNQPAFSVRVTPRYFEEESLPLLAELLEVPEAVLAERVQEASKYSSYVPSIVMNGLPFDRLSRLTERLDDLPGVDYEATQKRRYPSPVRASHVLGYVREIAGDDLANGKADGYRPGDLIGQRGIERIYESELRGNLGSDFRLVNVHGQDVSPFRNGVEDVNPVKGRDLVLTIDADLQALAESLFVGKRGAAVALDPNTGEILSLVSKPDFDLDLFTRQISGQEWTGLNASVEKPLFNRATQSVQMPGSTWKPLIAMIALEEGVITPNETVHCPGYHPMGRGRFFRCMHVHGNIAVVEAVQESCNTFFFEMMRRLDVNAFARHARSMGFGEVIDTDLTEQATGLIPDSSYYNRAHGRWTVGYQMNLGVGQGELSVTPLQLARYTAAVATEGKVVTPHLIAASVNPETGTLQAPDVPPPTPLAIRPEFVGLAKEAMRRVMVAGTGRGVQIPGIPSGGKTGTAQNERGRDDSVFIMFAPFDNPQIAVAVSVENAGFGGSAAAPIASLMAEQYLTGQVTRPDIVRWMLQTKSDPMIDKTNGE